MATIRNGRAAHHDFLLSLIEKAVMRESLRTRLMRWGFNLFPAYRRTGGRITYIAGDMHEVRIRLPLNWQTRNYVGTIFGGSMYGAIDPIYMVMFIKLLGSDVIVWDKAATISFKRPGRTTLYASFVVEPSELQLIRQALETDAKVDRTYRVELKDSKGVIHAVIDKVLHFRRKMPPQ